MFRRRGIQLGAQLVRFASEESRTKTKAVYTGERGINKVTLLGRVGRDAEVRGTQENPVSLFPLATSRSFMKADGTYEQMTEWHRIAVFRPGLRDIVADRVKKGDKVYVSGMIKYNTYSASEKDQPQQSTSIIADDVLVVSKKVQNADAEEL